MSLNWAKKNIVGKRFGRLLVLSESTKRSKNGSVYWNCICNCGQKIVSLGTSLRAEQSKSCGCLRLEKTRKKWGESSFNKLYSGYKRNAKDRGLNFRLSKKQFKKLTSDNCYYCGEKPLYKSENNGKNKFYGIYTYNGIDRMDNNIGYALDNCVTCCAICNQIKSTMDKREFIGHVRKIYENNEQQKS